MTDNDIHDVAKAFGDSVLSQVYAKRPDLFSFYEVNQDEIELRVHGSIDGMLYVYKYAVMLLELERSRVDSAGYIAETLLGKMADCDGYEKSIHKPMRLVDLAA